MDIARYAISAAPSKQLAAFEAAEAKPEKPASGQQQRDEDEEAKYRATLSPAQRGAQRLLLALCSVQASAANSATLLAAARSSANRPFTTRPSP